MYTHTQTGHLAHSAGPRTRACGDVVDGPQNSSSTLFCLLLLLGKQQTATYCSTTRPAMCTAMYLVHVAPSIKAPRRADNLVSCQCSFVFIKWRLTTSPNHGTVQTYYRKFSFYNNTFAPHQTPLISIDYRAYLFLNNCLTPLRWCDDLRIFKKRMSIHSRTGNTRANHFLLEFKSDRSDAPDIPFYRKFNFLCQSNRKRV